MGCLASWKQVVYSWQHCPVGWDTCQGGGEPLIAQHVHVLPGRQEQPHRERGGDCCGRVCPVHGACPGARIGGAGPGVGHALYSIWLEGEDASQVGALILQAHCAAGLHSVSHVSPSCGSVGPLTPSNASMAAWHRRPPMPPRGSALAPQPQPARAGRCLCGRDHPPVHAGFRPGNVPLAPLLCAPARASAAAPLRSGSRGHACCS